jgi:hypothetical protein
MTFNISGKVNQPIVRVWGTENPYVTLEDERDAQNCVLCSFKGKGLWIPLPSFWGVRGQATPSQVTPTLTC